MARQRRRRSGWGRRLLIFLVLCGLGFLFFQWSNHSLQTERFTFQSERLPEAFDGFVMVQLSDLHGAYFGEENEELIEKVKAEAPNVIL